MSTFNLFEPFSILLTFSPSLLFSFFFSFPFLFYFSFTWKSFISETKKSKIIIIMKIIPKIDKEKENERNAFAHRRDEFSLFFFLFFSCSFSRNCGNYLQIVIKILVFGGFHHQYLTTQYCQ